jgi:catechol 2,3-dioxygenase-like lactoylglutathione lyase family enzyme
MNDSNEPAAAHVGVTVPDVAAAVAFYSTALDMQVLVPPTEVPMTSGHGGEFCEAFFPGFRGMRVARMVTDQGFALELFEWEPTVGGLTVDRPVHHETPGYFHVAFVDPNVEQRVQRIVAAGGRRRTKTWQVWEGQPYLACYCEDPFGNIVEIISHTEPEMHGQPQPARD